MPANPQAPSPASSFPKARVDQLLSRFGYCSRSEASRWIRHGRISTPQLPVTDPAQKIIPTDLRVDGEPPDFPDGLFVAFYKPAGLVCSHDSSEGPSIYDHLPPRWPRRNPSVTSVGRLDKDATGLLLLTDVGTLVHHFTSPRKHIAKVYEVETDLPIPRDLISIFASGALQLDGEPRACQPATLDLDPVHPNQARLTLHEGKYHQVKRMFASQGLRVTRLHRTHFGPYTLNTLLPGEWIPLPLPSGDSR